MKNRLFSFAAVCVAASVVALLVGCFHPVGSGKAGALTVSIKNVINTRTLLPPISMDAASYTVEGTGPNGASFSRSSSGESVTVEELTFGTWVVTVNALNAEGTVIGQGQNTATLVQGQTVTLEVAVTPLGGTGSLELSVTWTASLQHPSIQASLTPPIQSALEFAVSGNQGTCSSSGIPAGYYTLTLQLLENNIPVMGAVEVVRIVSEQTTSGAYDFTHVNMGTVEVNITPALANPIPVNIGEVPATLPVGTSATVSASVSDGTPNVVYVWYVNGVSKATGPSYTFGSDLGTGYYRLDVTAFTSDGLRGGSATANFQVVKITTPIDVAGYWDWYVALTGEGEGAPSLLCIQQTGSTLEGDTSFGLYMTGSIVGSRVSLSGPIQGTTVTFNGTLSGGEISGTVSAPGIGQGTFRMVPSTLQFGHLDIQGSFQGAPILLTTEHTVGLTPEINTFYTFGFDLNLGGMPGSVRFEARNLSVGNYTVVESANQPDQMAVSVGQGGPSFNAAAGSVNISRYDGTGIEGTFNVSYPNGSNLDGSFDLVFGSGSGTITIHGSWLGSAVQSPAPGSTISYYNANTTTLFRLIFLNEVVSGWMWFNFAGGDLHTGTYSSPMETWIGFVWRPQGGVEIDPESMSSGIVNITRFDAAGVAGSYAVSYPTGVSIAGSFDVAFTDRSF